MVYQHTACQEQLALSPVHPYSAGMDQTHDADLRIAHPPTTLRELAVERLRQAIISGRFPGGARLVERTLCDQLGVSRSVVREAIRYLEAEGLVETLPRSGPVVAKLDWARAGSPAARAKACNSSNEVSDTRWPNCVPWAGPPSRREGCRHAAQVPGSRSAAALLRGGRR